MNRGFPVLDLARGRDHGLLSKRIAASGNEIAIHVITVVKMLWTREAQKMFFLRARAEKGIA